MAGFLFASGLSLVLLSSLTTANSHDTTSTETRSCQWNSSSALQEIISSQPLQCAPVPPRNVTREEWYRLGWDGPKDCLPSIVDYCIYTKLETPSSPRGHGMTVISTEKSMRAITAYPPQLLDADKKPELVPGVDFYPAEVPGKGIGLIANRTIKKGQIIMRRRPSLLVQYDIPWWDAPGAGSGNGANELSGEERLEIYEKAVMGRMDGETRELFMSQVGENVVAKVDRNAFRLFVDGDEGHLGSYPEVSRFNHDCRPNVHYRITNLTHVTVAVRDIPKGEELTVSYIDGMITHAERQERLESWGFKCACHACSQGLAQIAASDGRVKEIAKIEAELEEKVGSGEDISLDIPDKLIKLYEDEMLDNYVAHPLTKAALLSSMFADEKRTVKYALLAVEALEREYGPNTKDGDAMMGLAQKPMEHWSWGIRKAGWRVL